MLVSNKEGVAPMVIVIGGAVALVLLAGGGAGYLYVNSQNEAKVQANMAQQQKIAELEIKLLELAAQQQGSAKPEDSKQAEAIAIELNKLKTQNSQLQKQMNSKPPPAPLESLPPPVSSATGLSVSQIIGVVKPSVVALDSHRGNASGFLVTDAFVVTNAHAVESVFRFKVRLHSGEEVIGYVAGIDEANDIAIIRIPKVSAPALSFGNADAVKQGDPVYAFGFPFGLSGETSFAEGVLSRRITYKETPYLEISNAIHPGNSGGPLVNAQGQVVGINTAIYGFQSDGGVSLGESIKFAVPGNLAKESSERLIRQATEMSLSTKSQIDAYEIFMERLQKVSDDLWTVLSYREEVVEKQQTTTLTQLIADASTVSTEAILMKKDLPATQFSSIMLRLVEAREKQAITLINIFELEMQIIKLSWTNTVNAALVTDLKNKDQVFNNLQAEYLRDEKLLNEKIKGFSFQ